MWVSVAPPFGSIHSADPMKHLKKWCIRIKLWISPSNMRVFLTSSQRLAAGPVHGADGFPTGLPQGQVVLVVRCDPRRAHDGPGIQTQRKEDAHESHQLQGRQHRHPDLLCATNG